MDSESKHPYSQHPPPNQVNLPPANISPGYPTPVYPGYPNSAPNYAPPLYPNAPEYNYENNPAYYPPPNNQVAPPPPGAYYPNAAYPNASYPNAGYPNAGYPNAGYPNAPYPNHSSGVPLQINIISSKIPTEALCQTCNVNVVSQVLKRPGNTAWIVCLILCCFCFPLCLYPLICDPCLDTYHICPRCQSVMSVRSP